MRRKSHRYWKMTERLLATQALEAISQISIAKKPRPALNRRKPGNFEKLTTPKTSRAITLYLSTLMTMRDSLDTQRNLRDQVRLCLMKISWTIKVGSCLTMKVTMKAKKVGIIAVHHKRNLKKGRGK